MGTSEKKIPNLKPAWTMVTGKSTTKNPPKFQQPSVGSTNTFSALDFGQLNQSEERESRGRTLHKFIEPS